MIVVVHTFHIVTNFSPANSINYQSFVKMPHYTCHLSTFPHSYVHLYVVILRICH